MNIPASAGSPTYVPRVVDGELDVYLASLRVIAIEGAKAVGKTATATQRARTVIELDDPDQLAVAEAEPRRLLDGDRPVLIDEWQRLPSVWDLARRAADNHTVPPGS
ncbi:MAG: AAA family ATPase, partial [Gaiellaceae bacterium]